MEVQVINYDSLVSVIIPIYNVKQYLKKCIESIICQTYSNLEIILVDDGSFDGSSILCDEYKERDHRIKVIHKQNQGLSSARNCGIDIAKGKYITFVDSDDFCSNNFIEVLYDICENRDCQIAQCLTFDFSEEDEVIRAGGCDNITIYTGKDMCQNIFTSMGRCCVPAQNKLYERILFEDIQYPVGKLHEDEYVTYKLFWKCDRIGVIGKELYFYRNNNPNSIMHSSYDIRRLDYIPALEERNDFFHKEKEMDLYAKSLFMLGQQLVVSYEKLQKSDEIAESVKREINLKMKKIAREVFWKSELSIKKRMLLIFKSYFFSVYMKIRRKNEKN